MLPGVCVLSADLDQDAVLLREEAWESVGLLDLDAGEVVPEGLALGAL